MKFLLAVAILALAQLSNGFPSKHRSLRNPELGDAFEGDMVLTDEQIANLNSKNGIRYEQYRWPNKTVPYELDSAHTEHSKSRILTALGMITAKTCIKFVPHTTEPDYVFVMANTDKCQSGVGRTGGRQTIWMDDSCQTGSIAHEFLHTLGFFHEQSRTDRDDYVRINYENIIDKEYVPNFDKYDAGLITAFGVPYDYESILHYPTTAFGKRDQYGNEAETITLLKAYFVKPGQREYLADSDALKVNKMYNCP